MALLKEGTVVVITKGADAGKKAEIIGLDGKMLRIRMESGKERNISFRHVEPVKA